MAVWSGERTAQQCEKVVKVNPNGVDVAPLKVFRLPDGDATIFLQGKKRGYIVEGRFINQDAAKSEMVPDAGGFYSLPPGTYEIRLPKVSIPLSATGFFYPRSTMTRLGILKSQTAVWDSGYEGEGSQVFHFLLPARIHRDETWVQFVLMGNESDAKAGYSGHYQGEKAAGPILPRTR